MNNIYEQLPRPLFVLAPMDDVTDTVFRRVVAENAPPDLFFTEFASVDGFVSAGKMAVEKKLRFTGVEKPLIAQLWGVRPENFYKTARELAPRDFDGIDLNMGCPVKNVIKLGACSALMQNRPAAHEIIEATLNGAGTSPVSIKTRLGQKDYDESWLEFLLEHKPAALTIHFRSVRELSKTDAHWELAPRIVNLRNKISPDTLIIGNGDVQSRQHGLELAKKYNVDGIMIGRGIFHNPLMFYPDAGDAWKNCGKPQRLDMYRRHIQLFSNEWGEAKNPAVLKKFAKTYVSGFDGAKELREKLMRANSATDLLVALAVE